MSNCPHAFFWKTIQNAKRKQIAIPKTGSPTTPASKNLATSRQKLTMYLLLLIQKERLEGGPQGSHQKDQAQQCQERSGHTWPTTSMKSTATNSELFLLWLLEYCRKLLKADNISLIVSSSLSEERQKSKVAKEDLNCLMSGPCWQLWKRHQQVLTTVAPTSPFKRRSQPSQKRNSLPILQPQRTMTQRMPSLLTESRRLSMSSKSICLVEALPLEGIPWWTTATDEEFENHIRSWNPEVGILHGCFPVLHPPHALEGRGIKGHGPSSLYCEMEAQVILDGALHHQYHQELVKLDWNIFAQLLQETISKLESAEPDILLRKELMVRLPTPSPVKSAPSTTKRKAPSQSNESSPKKQTKPQCPICEKFHHG